MSGDVALDLAESGCVGPCSGPGGSRPRARQSCLVVGCTPSQIRTLGPACHRHRGQVSAAGEPVPHVLAGGGVDECGAGPGVEVIPVGEAGGGCRRPRRAARLHRTGRCHTGPSAWCMSARSGQFLVGGPGALVDPLEVADQLGDGTGSYRSGHEASPWPAASWPARRKGPSPRRRNQFQQGQMQLGGLPGALPPQRSAAVGRDPATPQAARR